MEEMRWWTTMFTARLKFIRTQYLEEVFEGGLRIDLACRFFIASELGWQQ
jgi:hypothetical protein